MDPSNPPLGIPPLIWLLIFLIGGPSTIALGLTKTAAKLPGIFGAMGRWWQGRDPQSMAARVDDAEIERLYRRYKQLADDAEHDRQMAERDRDEYRKGIQELKRLHDQEILQMNAKIDSIKDSLTKSNKRMWAAIGYIRILVDAIRRIDPDHQIPNPPDELIDII